jgi:hypothetical protein
MRWLVDKRLWIQIGSAIACGLLLADYRRFPIESWGDFAVIVVLGGIVAMLVGAVAAAVAHSWFGDSPKADSSDEIWRFIYVVHTGIVMLGAAIWFFGGQGERGT